MPRTGRFPNVVKYSDVTADDSDKTFTVPAGKVWRLLSVYARLQTTSTVGNRSLVILCTDDADVTVMKYVRGAVQAASLDYYYLFAPDHPQETTWTNALQLRALSDALYLPAGYKVRIYDEAAIAAAADDLSLYLLVEEFSEAGA